MPALGRETTGQMIACPAGELAQPRLPRPRGLFRGDPARAVVQVPGNGSSIVRYSRPPRLRDRIAMIPTSGGSHRGWRSRGRAPVSPGPYVRAAVHVRTWSQACGRPSTTRAVRRQSRRAVRSSAVRARAASAPLRRRRAADQTTAPPPWFSRRYATADSFSPLNGSSMSFSAPAPGR